ncbi:sphingosine 1-phosphate receptor 1 [Episyrphus balteatus]|uniref:sphingosine 1-phosphate receptor 1 n=1 Tax=Episyrphus balteatus TaxID=286459 RepID=UPI002485AD9E|nr:sphingosine 1-phosphate receptor 1 [Episyrphus balteatus]
MGGFTLCWLPYFTVASLQIFVMFDACPILYRAALALVMANSGLNPIIYAWKNTNFRRSFCRLLQCKNPNGASNNDYSVWEHSPRNGSQQKKTSDVSSPIESRLRSQSIESTNVAVVNCNPDPRNITDSPETNKQFVFNLSTCRNQLTSYESFVPAARIFYSPCEVCKILVGRKVDSKNNLNGLIIPWNCEEFNHNNIVNTIKCRW